MTATLTFGSSLSTLVSHPGAVRLELELRCWSAAKASANIPQPQAAALLHDDRAVAGTADVVLRHPADRRADRSGTRRRRPGPRSRPRSCQRARPPDREADRARRHDPRRAPQAPRRHRRRCAPAPRRRPHACRVVGTATMPTIGQADAAQHPDDGHRGPALLHAHPRRRSATLPELTPTARTRSSCDFQRQEPTRRRRGAPSTGSPSELSLPTNFGVAVRVRAAPGRDRQLPLDGDDTRHPRRRRSASGAFVALGLDPDGVGPAPAPRAGAAQDARLHAAASSRPPSPGSRAWPS